jgi:peptidyl-prolyl cis-trans isomerase SurA
MNRKITNRKIARLPRLNTVSFLKMPLLLWGALMFAALPLAVSAADSSPAASTGSNAQSSQGIAAVANDTLITDYDLDQRVKLFFATSGTQATKESMAAIRDQILHQLTDEALELQEAAKYKVKVESAQIDAAIATVAEQNKLTLDQITEILKNNGVAMNTLRNEISVQIAWNSLVQGRYGDEINVTDADVDAVVRRLKESANKPQFQVAEIFLPVDSSSDDARVRTNAQQIVTQIQSGASFQALARQFSQSPSAAQGGDMGWIVAGQISPVLDAELQKLQTGQLSAPIRDTGGYYILMLRQRQEPEGTKIPEVRETSLNEPIPLVRLLLPVPESAGKESRNNALTFAKRVVEQVNSCAQIKAVADQIQGSEFFDLGKMKPATTAQQMRTALIKTQPGQVAEPFLSSAGAEIIARCDTPPPKLVAFQMPTREEVQTSLHNEQLSTFARRYLRDLRRNAVVEYH